MGYENQHRSQRQYLMDGTNDYMPQQMPTQSASSSHIYQQNQNLSRAVALPESQHGSRRSNSYNLPNRQMQNDMDGQHDGTNKKPSFILFDD